MMWKRMTLMTLSEASYGELAFTWASALSSSFQESSCSVLYRKYRIF